MLKLFEFDGIKLEFNKSALDFIVDKAVDYGLGARGPDLFVKKY